MKNTLLSIRPLSVSGRMMGRLAPAFVWCGALGLLVGCASGPSSYLITAPPPAAPNRSPLTATTPDFVAVASSAVEVTNPGFIMNSAGPPFGPAIVPRLSPPDWQPEIALAQPSSTHVWVAGYWSWHHGGYVWTAGRWTLPPSADSEWVAPHWAEFGRGYEFFAGYWNPVTARRVRPPVPR